jgi:hypothetical protein
MEKAETKLWNEIDKQMDFAIDATNPAKDQKTARKPARVKNAVAELRKFIEMLGKVPAK